jgi:hypothetical protein
MSENKKAINEFFFKKKETYADKLKRKLPQYEPQDVRDEGQPEGFGGILAPTDNGLAVTDPREAGKRVVSALGASIGVNTVRNIASKSIKSFPIVISEGVEPETSVMLKRVLEEQYAEYISLLISNQVVDISAYKTGEKEGNVAIQALDSVSSEEEAKILSRKIASGEVDPEDFLKNLTAYNLVRNEGKQYKTGNQTLDTLLEGAVIVPAADSKSLVEFIVTHSDEIASLREDVTLATSTPRPGVMPPVANPTPSEQGTTSTVKNSQRGDSISLRDFMRNDLGISPAKAEKALDTFDELKNIESKGQRFGKLESPDVMLHADDIKKSINKSLADILMDKNNEAIRDRFQKATFLLEARRISGKEWADYLIKRLGIPVSSSVRVKVIDRYPTKDLSDPSGTGERLITRRDIRAIDENRRITETSLLTLLRYSGKELLIGGLTAGITVGIAGVAGLAAAASALPIFLILGAAVGVSTAAINAAFRRKKFLRKTGIEGWERVEALIEAMEDQQNAVRNLRVVEKPSDEQVEKLSAANKYADDNITASSVEITKALEDYSDYFTKLTKKASAGSQTSITESDFKAEFTEEERKYLISEASELVKAALKGNKLQEAALLSEALISTETPIELVATQSYEYDPKKGPEVLVVPKFTTRSQYAYGSTEYEKKDLKDRRYNAPLLMTVKFKERFDDGKFSDSELVAVIGILGVVTRVPTKEMEYILSSNAENKTIKGILEPDGDPAQLISNIIGIEKIKKDVESLPISKDVWQNLEKVSRLAISNSLAGRKNDNIANAHIVFAQKEIDNIRADMNVDYMKDIRLVKSLLKRYSAFTVMIANDVSEKIYIFDNQENVNWDVVPYSSFRNKDSGEQLNALLSKMSSGRM